MVGAKDESAIMMPDRMVGVGPNDEGLNGPSEGYRFYYGDKGEPLQGSDSRCAL